MAYPLLRTRPLFWPTLITLPAVALALALGAWQVQRLVWKNGLIADRQAKSRAAPLPSLPETFVAAEHEFRRVAVTGRFLHEKELYLGARSMKGNPGYQVVTPFLVAGREDRPVLVNRGWVPLAEKAPSRRPHGQVAGTVTVEGYLRAPAPRGWFTPDNEPARNFWFYVDPPAMAAAAGLAHVAPFLIEAGPAPNPGGFPIGGQTRIDLPNDHLQYALTWFALAVTGAAVYVLYHRKRAAEDAAAGAARASAGPA